MNGIYFCSKLEEVNPFHEKGIYDGTWVQLVITERSEYAMMTRKTLLFQFTVSTFYAGWQLRAMDFISYQAGYGRNIIVTASPERYAEAQEIYRGHSKEEAFLRSYEPRFLVHSAPPGAVPFILRDGALRSWNRVKSAGQCLEDAPIGALLGDPEDFRDYIMLGEGLAPEVVVSSKEKGKICMDPDCSYTPGARFYFDSTRLLSKGLLVRDGCHYKVKEELPLHLAVYTASMQTLQLQDGQVTPRIFTQAADQAFASYLQAYQPAKKEKRE